MNILAEKQSTTWCIDHVLWFLKSFHNIFFKAREMSLSIVSIPFLCFNLNLSCFNFFVLALDNLFLSILQLSLFQSYISMLHFERFVVMHVLHICLGLQFW